MLKKSLAWLAVGAMLSAPATPASSSMPATPLPAATAIKLDGAFTEAIWEEIPAISDFRQRDPKDGAPPTFATDVKVAYDASNLYVAVRAHDPEPGRIVGLRTSGRSTRSRPSPAIRSCRPATRRPPSART
jgi:hypothetical protein